MTQPPGTVPMLDVSAAQGVIGWDSMAASGVQAVYVETAIGNDSPNPCRLAQLAGARAAGLKVGVYSFLYPIGLSGAGRTPEGQAALHMALDPGGLDLPPVIDLEWPEPAQWSRWGCSAQQIVDWVLAYVLARGDSPTLYTMPGFMQALGHPILGDTLYADPATRDKADRLLLHAEHLAFVHPQSAAPLSFDCPAPF